MLTLRVREHAHQRGKLRRAAAMGDMKPAASRAMHAATLLSSRLLLLLLLRRLRRLLVVLLHGGQIGVGVARRVRSDVAGSARTGVSVGNCRAKSWRRGAPDANEATSRKSFGTRWDGIRSAGQLGFGDRGA